MRTWLLGCLVAAFAASFIGCGGTEGIDGTDSVVAATNDSGRGGSGGDDRHENQCRERAKICKTIESCDNITHVFIDLPRCFDGHSVHKVVAYDAWDDELRRYDRRDLKKKGGPCKGDVKRDFWFPLRGNQMEAKICVFLERDDHGELPRDVGIGFKAGGVCEPDHEMRRGCESCERDHGHDDHGDACGCPGHGGRDDHGHHGDDHDGHGDHHGRDDDRDGHGNDRDHDHDDDRDDDRDGRDDDGRHDDDD